MATSQIRHTKKVNEFVRNVSFSSKETQTSDRKLPAKRNSANLNQSAGKTKRKSNKLYVPCGGRHSKSFAKVVY